ncbi:MAG: LytR C-terminal domain-containing protein, partial [Solirubrobacterales bacterium]
GVEERRGIAGIVGTVLVLAIVVVVVVIQTGNGGEEALERPRASAVVPADVEVAVLNGTPVPDLAARVGEDVEANDFTLCRVTNSESPFEKTVVMYEPGSEDEGQAVGKALGLARVLPMAPDVRALAEGAPVVVIAGEDRAQQ